MAEKEFQKWNERKIILHEASRRPFFAEGDVWYCMLGENIGDEENGKGNIFLRPVVVLKKFNSRVFWGVPLTRTTKHGLFYFPIENIGSVAILSQIRLLDAKRL